MMNWLNQCNFNLDHMILIIIPPHNIHVIFKSWSCIIKKWWWVSSSYHSWFPPAFPMRCSHPQFVFVYLCICVFVYLSPLPSSMRSSYLSMHSNSFPSLQILPSSRRRTTRWWSIPGTLELLTDWLNIELVTTSCFFLATGKSFLRCLYYYLPILLFSYCIYRALWLFFMKKPHI